MAVLFHFEGVSVSLKNRKRLKAFIPKIFQKEGKLLKDISYIFCTDAYLLQLNKNYLAHDTLTDILTFDLSETEKEIISEIYISVERVRENAMLFGTSFEKELHRVIFHGILHLCGYDDHSEKEKNIMRKKENEYLDSYFG